MAYKQIKLQDYVPSTTLDAHAQAAARKLWYESEDIRIAVAARIQRAKDEGKPIMVQGNKDD